MSTDLTGTFGAAVEVEEPTGPLTGNPISAPEEEDFVGKVHETARKDALRDHNHSMAQEGGNENGVLRSGRMATGAGASMATTKTKVKKRKEKDRKAIMRAGRESLKALERRLAELDREIAALDEKIEELDKDISKTEKALEEKYGPDWREKQRRGELPKDDPLLLQLMSQQERREYYQRQRDEKAAEREQVSDKLDSLYEAQKLARNSGDVESENTITEAIVENVLHVSKTRNDQMDYNDARDQVEIQKDIMAIENVSEVDQEVHHFMVGIEKVKLIEDDLERMALEQKLVQGLSEEAKMTLEEERDTKHLFVENYFKPLNDDSTTAQTEELQGSTPTNSVSPV